MTQQQPTLTPTYLRSLAAVRQRSQLVYKLAQEKQLDWLVLHEDKLDEVVDYCIDVIKRDYGQDYASIPPHSRWRHFVTPKRGDQLGPVVQSWQEAGIEKREVAKRLIDLFVVSVLLDAGAGPTWKYYSASTGEYAQRSEGLALASLDMFLQGIFNSDIADSGIDGRLDAPKVDSTALKRLTVDDVAKGLQHGKVGFVTGLQGRAELLIRLGEALEARPDIFKGEDGSIRPGNMVDYLCPEGTVESTPTIEVDRIWDVVMDGLGPIWPEARTTLEGVSLGDAWKCNRLAQDEEGEAAGIVPFHKLSQWLTYSLMEPLQKVLECKINGVERMTGLPEYRNGGLLIDLGFLELNYDKGGGWGTGPKTLDMPQPNPTENRVPRVTVDSQIVVQWRAITVIALDKIAEAIKKKLGAPDLSTAQILEAATWKAGRQVAKESRQSGGPPIDIISDGTVF